MREMGRRAGGDGVHGLGRAAGMGKWHATHQGVWMREAPGVSALRFGAAGGLGLITWDGAAADRVRVACELGRGAAGARSRPGVYALL